MSDVAHWYDRYCTTELIRKTEPNQFPPREVAGLAPGRALACPERRHRLVGTGTGTDTGTVTAIDCVVRAHRPNESR